MAKKKRITKNRLAKAIFEGLIIRTEGQATVRRVAQGNGLQRCAVSALGADLNGYLLSPPRSPGVAGAWHSPTGCALIAPSPRPSWHLSCKALIRYRHRLSVPASKAASAKPKPLPESDDCEWSLKHCKVSGAWNFSANNQQFGAKPRT